MRASHAEGKPWQRELQKYLSAYRSTPHTTTGVSPAELLHGRRIGTKMPEFESTEEEGERPGTTDQGRHGTRMLNINKEVLMV